MKTELQNKILQRKNVEDRLIESIRNGNDINSKDLNMIYALTAVIVTLKKLDNESSNL